MSKFIKKETKKTPKKTVKKEKPVVVEEVKVEEKPIEVIKKGDQEFVICPKCGWQHPYGTTHCRFCGGKIK